MLSPEKLRQSARSFPESFWGVLGADWGIQNLIERSNKLTQSVRNKAADSTAEKELRAILIDACAARTAEINMVSAISEPHSEIACVERDGLMEQLEQERERMKRVASQRLAAFDTAITQHLQRVQDEMIRREREERLAARKAREVKQSGMSESEREAEARLLEASEQLPPEDTDIRVAPDKATRAFHALEQARKLT